ncbi:MAG TPA: tripartite tricarboxylate transporter substrate binding protein [Xanthobacteraceae bacterium]
MKSTRGMRRAGLPAPGLAFVLALFIAAVPPSHAQDAASYPTRSVRLIVPTAPGGTMDIVARTLAQVLAPAIGAQVFIENKPGGNNNIGASYVARATPDGYTLLVHSDSFTSNASVFKDPGYDALTSFEPITMLAKAPGALAVRSDLGLASLDDFVTYSKRNGKALMVASTGIGTVSHLTGIMFQQKMGLPPWTDVPYPGAAKAVTDVIGHHVDSIFVMVAPLVPFDQSGDLKILAVTTAARSAAVPNVRTVAEQTGLKDFNVANWVALFAPAGTPKPIVAKLAREVVAALHDPAVTNSLAQLGLEVAGDGPAPLAAEVRSKVLQWHDVIARAGLKVE